MYQEIKKEIESLGFSVVSHDFERPWGGFLVIDETQAQDFSAIYLSEYIIKNKTDYYTKLRKVTENNDLINELITITDNLLDRSKGASTKLIKYVSDRPGHDFRYGIDSSKLKNQLGWKVSDNFNENIEKTVSWYIKENG